MPRGGSPWVTSGNDLDQPSGHRCVVASVATTASIRRAPDGLDVSHGQGAPELAPAAFIADVD